MQASIQQWSISQFRLLVVLMIIVGATQGLVSPLISTMLEQNHVSASTNGISAAMLYMGMFISMFFCAKLLKLIGYRQTILMGIGIMFVSIVAFPFTQGIWWWSLLRFLLGIGDNITTFAVQIWVARHVSKEENGKRFSQFGLSYGLGMGLGPLGLNLISFGFAVPFVVLAVALVIAVLFCFAKLQKDVPIPSLEKKHTIGQASYRMVYRMGFLAMWSALIYGFIEVAVASNFPVYGLKTGFSKVEISLLITAFIWGSLLFQLPLGILGDKMGRHKLLLIICSIGGSGMLAIPFFHYHVNAMVFILGFMGGIIGSMLSLSLAFLSDLLPESMITKGNLLANSHFTFGSIIGPYIGGLLMQYISIVSLFYFLGISLFSFVLFSFLIQQAKKEKVIINDINMH
ncbi:MFS transporter [Shimazuella sp. AN120528]|uniref:MFS transporter n=1 Tax=Shimazuella soli TaxID=1892854 RepID=UPI001F0D1465|nr:MFS transporter [Shimazuella soli]MCH5584818.1 MFS transporter [Shimazuella soli]